jgi:NTE family protein
VSPANDWFVSGYAGVERRRLLAFDADSGDERAEFKRLTSEFGLDLGQPWGQIGELRLGLSHVRVRTSPQLLSVDYSGPTDRLEFSESGLRARVVVDQLDYANFPLAGYRAEGLLWGGQRGGDLSGSFRRLEAQGTWVTTLGAHTINLHGRVALTEQSGTSLIGRYALGGFHQLSGYQVGQLQGNALAFLRAGWYMRLTRTPTLTRGFFVGATLEAGNVWTDRRAVDGSGLRTGGSLYLGADTGIGPLYLGLTYAARGRAGLALFIGRP